MKTPSEALDELVTNITPSGMRQRRVSRTDVRSRSVGDDRSHEQWLSKFVQRHSTILLNACDDGDDSRLTSDEDRVGNKNERQGIPNAPSASQSPPSPLLPLNSPHLLRGREERSRFNLCPWPPAKTTTTTPTIEHASQVWQRRTESMHLVAIPIARAVTRRDDDDDDERFNHPSTRYCTKQLHHIDSSHLSPGNLHPFLVSRAVWHSQPPAHTPVRDANAPLQLRQHDSAVPTVEKVTVLQGVQHRRTRGLRDLASTANRGGEREEERAFGLQSCTSSHV